MGNESGTWIMYGVSREDPECIHTVDEAVEYINKVGFLPLFKNEEAYGWPVAVYCTPEHLWGRDHVTSAYTESAASSGEKIAAHMREIYPIATRQQVHRLVGNIVAL